MSRTINLNGKKPHHIPQEQWDLMKEKFDEIYADNEDEIPD